MKEAYKKCMKEKNTIKIKSYESPCGVLLLGSFGGKLCLCDWQVEKHCDRVNQRLKRVLCAEFEISTSEIIEETISYGEMARHIGMPQAVRAVANANGANSISIFAPCHRVIGSDHSLTGYGGGLSAKRFLLELESQPRLML